MMRSLGRSACAHFPNPPIAPISPNGSVQSVKSVDPAVEMHRPNHLPSPEQQHAGARKPCKPEKNVGPGPLASRRPMASALLMGFRKGKRRKREEGMPERLTGGS